MGFIFPLMISWTFDSIIRLIFGRCKVGKLETFKYYPCGLYITCSPRDTVRSISIYKKWFHCPKLLSFESSWCQEHLFASQDIDRFYSITISSYPLLKFFICTYKILLYENKVTPWKARALKYSEHLFCM